jgi:hypothetical protein
MFDISRGGEEFNLRPEITVAVTTINYLLVSVIYSGI